MKRTICVLIIFLLFMGLGYFNQLGATQKNEKFHSNSAIYNAYSDANDPSFRRAMFFNGLIFGPLGAIFVRFSTPKPNPANLVGKDPEYVKIYVRNYKYYASRFSSRYANMGCAYSMLGLIGVYITEVIIKTKWEFKNE